MTFLRGVIFDFNGTLLFDTPFHEQAWRQYVETLCGRSVSDEEFRDHVHGRTNAEILRYFVGDGLTDEETARHGEAKEALYREICLQNPEQFRLAGGAEDYLDRLKARGVPMAVATSSGKSNADFYWERLGLERWFSRDTFVYHDGIMRSKPCPDIYWRAAAAIKVPTEECTVFEDMPSGIAAARASGAGRIVAVASSLEPAYLLSLDGVDRVIRDYTEMTD